MKKEPDYYDSQASAAAALNISIYDLRDAKRDGCLAFRSGRVYRQELLDYLESKRAGNAASVEDGDLDLCDELSALDIKQAALSRRALPLLPERSRAKARKAFAAIRRAVSDLWDVIGLPDHPEDVV